MRVHTRIACTCNIFRVRGDTVRMPCLPSRKCRWPNSICFRKTMPLATSTFWCSNRRSKHDDNSSGWFSTVFPSCGGEIKRTPSLSGGTITSPNVNGSTLYGNNLHCQWTIRVDQGEKIQLQFTDFDVETSTDCSADYLQVSEQSTNDTTKRFCGLFQPDSWTSTGNVVLLSFVTDGAVQSSGFNVSWRAITDKSKLWNILLERWGEDRGKLSWWKLFLHQSQENQPDSRAIKLKVGHWKREIVFIGLRPDGAIMYT